MLQTLLIVYLAYVVLRALVRRLRRWRGVRREEGLSGMNGEQGVGSNAGPLTAITAVRVEAQVEQFVVETIRWADRMQEPDPVPVTALFGTLGDFDPDRKTGQGKTVHSLRLLPPDSALVGRIRTQAEKALAGNSIVVRGEDGRFPTRFARTSGTGRP